jgi:hypothetical protein
MIRCKAVRDLIRVDWNCDLRILDRTEHLGCRDGVSTALDWFFTHEAEGIVLEDDCIPNDSFWPYCAEMLERYRDDVRVASVAGVNYEQGRARRSSSYYFSRHVYVWGWATWRRVWQSVDRNLTDWPELRKQGWLRSLLGSEATERYWIRALDKAHAREIDAWSYYMLYSSWTKGQMSVVPTRNLVTNIGFGPDAVHTKKSTRYDRMATEELSFPLQHPHFEMVDEAADRLVAERMYSRYPLPRRVWNRANAEIEAIMRQRRDRAHVRLI